MNLNVIYYKYDLINELNESNWQEWRNARVVGERLRVISDKIRQRVRPPVRSADTMTILYLSELPTSMPDYVRASPQSSSEITFELSESDRQESPTVFVSGNLSENRWMGGLLLNIPFLHVKL